MQKKGKTGVASGRVRLAEQNIAFGYIGQTATALMSFVLRTIFIRHLSEQLLGVILFIRTSSPSCRWRSLESEPR